MSRLSDLDFLTACRGIRQAAKRPIVARLDDATKRVLLQDLRFVLGIRRLKS